MSDESEEPREKDEEQPDVEGHRRMLNEQPDDEQDDGPDVEGHRKIHG
jgi:hypothetical protein